MSGVEVVVGGIRLAADLEPTQGARGVVVFAHGSGSGRHSPRNRAVAESLREAGFTTLLLDLLTPEESRLDERDRSLRFDIPLLAERLVAAIEHVCADLPTRALPIGLFGSSTGAAAALLAAAARPDVVCSVVSRGARPDLAGSRLRDVKAPVLLVVGGRDPEVLRLNELAAELLAHAELVVVPGATHLFEEPGALDDVIGRAAGWFQATLSG